MPNDLQISVAISPSSVYSLEDISPIGEIYDLIRDWRWVLGLYLFGILPALSCLYGRMAPSK